MIYIEETTTSLEMLKHVFDMKLKNFPLNFNCPLCSCSFKVLDMDLEKCLLQPNQHPPLLCQPKAQSSNLRVLEKRKQNCTTGKKNRQI